MKHANVYCALAAAQAEFDEIPCDKVGQDGNRKFKYADLSNIRKATQPALSRHGLALWHMTDIRDGQPVLVTGLNHGASETYIASVHPLSPGLQVKHRGAELTYLRRYSVSAILNVVGDADADDDATHEAMNAGQRQNGRQKPSEPRPGVSDPDSTSNDYRGSTVTHEDPPRFSWLTIDGSRHVEPDITNLCRGLNKHARYLNEKMGDNFRSDPGYRDWIAYNEPGIRLIMSQHRDEKMVEFWRAELMAVKHENGDG